MTTTAVPYSSLLALIAEHLLPGVLLLLLWCVCAPALLDGGAPPVLGLLLGVPVVLLPGVAIGLSRLRGQEAAGTPVSDFVGVHRLRGRDVLTRILPLGLAAAVLPGLAIPIESALRRLVGPALPDWWDLSPALRDGPTPLTAWVLLAVLLGPIVEEIWFRGVLQPRLPGCRATRVLLGSALFTVYHLWQPWAWPTVLLTTLPVAVLRETRAGTTGAVLVHVLVNAVAFALLLVGALQR